MKKILLQNMNISEEIADKIEELGIDTTFEENEDGVKFFKVSDEQCKTLNDAFPFADWQIENI